MRRSGLRSSCRMKIALRTLNTAEAGFRAALTALLDRAQLLDTKVEAVVREVVGAVRTRGDGALMEYTASFDRWAPDAVAALEIPPERFAQAHIRRDDLLHRVDLVQLLSRNGLLENALEHPHVAECRGRGLLAAIEIVRDRATLEPFPVEANVTNRVIAKALTKGVFFYGGGTGEIRDIVCMGPPFITSCSELASMVEVLLETVDEIVK